MARAVRKQLYLSPEHNRLVKELAARWNTTEAAVVRKALDRLAESERRRRPDRRTEKERQIDELLRQAGMLGGGGEPLWPIPKIQPPLPPELQELERARTERLGGGNDVIADREERARIIAGQPLDD
ncbi:MAG TPA: hypothetical protein VG370_33945 [Chloroflexota bacterium]|nr:hypothetical protein [Chloroflexota bacterium]